jgi:hypothetical protein
MKDSAVHCNAILLFFCNFVGFCWTADPAGQVESSLMLRPTLSRPVYTHLRIKHPSGAYDKIFITVSHLRVCCCGALSLMRGRICRFTTSDGRRQRSHFRVRVSWDSRPYFTVSDIRLRLLSPPTDPASYNRPSLYRLGTDNIENTVCNFETPLLGFPRDRYTVSSLACWLLPINSPVLLSLA